MKTKTIFVCSFCNTLYEHEAAAKQCEETCVKKEMRREEAKQWYKDNPSKFKVGDLVHINMSKTFEEYPNRFFVIEEIEKAANPYVKQWVYRGNTGDTYEAGGIDPYCDRWVAEEALELVMDKDAYAKKIDEICKHFNIQRKRLVRFCRNRKAFEVILPFED